MGIVEARQIPLEHPKKFDPVDGSTSWASGACMMIRAELLQQVGGFDGDSFFMYCDDVDFSWRARLAGYQVIHQPSARVFHDKRIQVDGRLVVSDAERYYSAEAALLMAWKYSRPDLVALWSEEMLATSESSKGEGCQGIPRPAQRLVRSRRHSIQRAGLQSLLGTTTASTGSTSVSDRDRLVSIEGLVHSHVVDLLRQHRAAEGKVVLDLGVRIRGDG